MKQSAGKKKKNASSDPFFRAKSVQTLLPYKVRTIGQTHDAPGHLTRGTYHGDATLMIVLSGKGDFNCAGEKHRLRTGMVGLVMPHPDPGIMSADPNDPYNFIHCRFAGHLALEAADRIIAARAGRPFFRFAAWMELAEILGRGVELDPGRSEQSPQKTQRVDAILAEALAFIDNPEIERSPGTAPLDGHAIRAYMVRQLDSPITLQPMAEFFCVTRHHLCRVARRDLGVTIQVYWEGLKMAHADLMLVKNDDPIREISRLLGYADPYYFSRVFRKHNGIGPREFRTQARKREQSHPPFE